MSYFVHTESGPIEVDRNMQDGTLPVKPSGLRIFTPDEPQESLVHPNPQHWNDVVLAAKIAAGWRCQMCNSGWRLQGHHRTYENWGRELVGDVTIACDPCHEVFTKYRRLAA